MADLLLLQDGQSVVSKQPTNEQDRSAAIRAMISCPTGSIRTETPEKQVKGVMNTFPLAIDADELPGVYHLGFHSATTYGAASYLIVREKGKGNVMVDTPRFNELLAKKIESMGGVPQAMVITHRDHVGEQAKWKVCILKNIDTDKPPFHTSHMQYYTGKVSQHDKILP